MMKVRDAGVTTGMTTAKAVSDEFQMPGVMTGRLAAGIVQVVTPYCA